MRYFRALTIPQDGGYWLKRARVPACFLNETVDGAQADADGALLLDLLIDHQRIAAIAPSSIPNHNDMHIVDLAGRHAWPTLVDMHTHLDKGHVVPRLSAADGSFNGARKATAADRASHWTAEDIERRMEFGLRCAYAHGVSAIRTHLDSYEGQVVSVWGIFRKLREKWSGRIALQGVALFPIDLYRSAHGYKVADLVAESGGILGGVTRGSQFDHSVMLEDTEQLLDTVFKLAAERDLDVDLHVDESSDPNAASLALVARAILRNRFKGRVVCGHCCSLAIQPEAQMRETIALCADAGLSIVSLPTVNMYLQDRTQGRTPRWRGVAPVHELRQAGVPVAIAGDNCRDGFYAYGDHDMVDTFREAVRIAHLDHPFADAPAMAGPIPSAIIGAGPIGNIETGAPARLILFNARSLNEMVCRPQSDRIVIDRGRPVFDEPPDYTELVAVG
jgi:cytosine deaminase